MKRVLCISPHFPPSNTADMHRLRTSLPYFEQFGWKATVLAVRPEDVEQSTDPLLEASLPEGCDVVRVRAWPASWTRRVGLGNLGLRALWSLFWTGLRLLRREKYDLIYISSTVFQMFILARWWRAWSGVPYVLDIQDPWYNQYYDDNPQARPPKYWFIHTLNRYMEPYVMKRVSGLIAVSKAYLDELEVRYAHLKKVPKQTLTFGAAQVDWTVAEQVSSSEIEPFLAQATKQPCFKGVYVGRGGPDMEKALGLVFKALLLGKQKQPALFDRVHLTFVGTDYAPKGREKKRVEPLAEAFGVAEHVQEFPLRIPYFHALSLLQKADFLVIVGSDDPSYSASKIYAQLLAKIPILLVFHEQSGVVEVVKKVGGVSLVTFSEAQGHTEVELLEKWQEMLQSLPYTPETNWDAFEHYSAREMTRHQCMLFEESLAAHQTDTHGSS
ncbi:glycosyltransferase [Magnetococcus sp. PR-3]|uniref:glycosyltransferase n=1 Tax=Magnetococcus sp. PR-3 TaxID=3120355 RepID=UPI002FCDFB48